MLLSAVAFTIFETIKFTSSSLMVVPTKFNGTTSTTSIVPSVMVPVLSTHKTSVLASISIEYKSCTLAFFLYKDTTPDASAIEVNKFNPAGIIATNCPDNGPIILMKSSLVLKLPRMTYVKVMLKKPKMTIIPRILNKVLSDLRI